MAFTESELLPISALQHLLFCERQCALIHLDGAWGENRLTAEGAVVHERVHEEGRETRGSRTVLRALKVRSLVLGLFGVTDAVEFHAPPGHAGCELGTSLSSLTSEQLGGWSVIPIEYKRGHPKPNACDEVQLAAQALCLEEMTGCAVPVGYLYYGQERHRTTVAISETLRLLTLDSARRLRTLLAQTILPPAARKPGCKNCSLVEQCMPACTDGTTSAQGFFMSEVGIAIAQACPLDDEVPK